MTPAPDPTKIPKSQRRDPRESALDYVNLINDSIQKGFERITTAHEKTAAAQAETNLNLVQVAAQIKATNQTLDKLGEKLDKMDDRLEAMRQTIAEHLKVAQNQSQNISELTKLVATQARTVEILVSRAS